MHKASKAGSVSVREVRVPANKPRQESISGGESSGHAKEAAARAHTRRRHAGNIGERSSSGGGRAQASLK